MATRRLFRPLAILVAALAAAAAQAQAQTPPAPQRPAPAVQLRANPPAASPAAPASREVLLDRVVAVVNDEAVTQHEIAEQRRTVMIQMRDAKVSPPPPDVLDRQVLERLITERALLQHARETGVRVDDTAVERTVQRIAQENKLSIDEFRKVLERENIPYARYREDIRREMTLQRLREREVDSRVSATDAEVDQFLATSAARDGGDVEYLLSHILVSVPEQSSPDQVAVRQQRAVTALQQVKTGGDFAQVAASFSDAQDALTGGSLGWRSAARLPTVFVEVVRQLEKGGVSNVIRSPAGFHVVKLVDARDRNAPTIVDQTRARHILVRVNETVSDADARIRIDRVKDRLDSGAKFEDMARVNSEDASAAKGGELGWLNPGDTVPEFEQAMDRLAVGETSGPVRSPFGWHLIKVDERRRQDVTRDRQREQARAAIRQRKADEQFQEFVRQTRDRAYVEYKADDR
jgi:peptidyl-prolyl cis-trans isomerase SurA